MEKGGRGDDEVQRVLFDEAARDGVVELLQQRRRALRAALPQPRCLEQEAARGGGRAMRPVCAAVLA